MPNFIDQYVNIFSMQSKCYKRGIFKALRKFLGMKDSSIDVTTSYPKVTHVEDCPCNTNEGR